MASLEVELAQSAGAVAVGEGLFEFPSHDSVNQVIHEPGCANLAVRCAVLLINLQILGILNHINQARIFNLSTPQAIKVLILRHPWLRHNDPSHAAEGDVITSCIVIGWQGKKFSHVKLVNFEH